MSNLLLWDQNITNYLYFESASELLKNITLVMATGFIYILPIVLVVMFFRSYRDRITSMKIFVGVVIAWQGLTKITGDFLYGSYGFRERPFAENGLSELFLEQPEKAFPSDHSAVLIVVILLLFVYKYPKLGYVFLIGGITSSLARVVIGFHWFGDIIGGWLLGALAVGIILVFDRQLTKVFEWSIKRFSKQYGRR